MGDVFISYVEEDHELAVQIAHGLQAAGYVTWYYEQDSIPGLTYLEQVGTAIDACPAIIVIISPNSLGSNEVTAEVVRAHQSNRRFVPVLHEISYMQFQQRQPVWRQAMGAATSISVPPDGVGAILPRIIEGLKALGIPAQSPEGPQPQQDTVRPDPTPCPGAAKASDDTARRVALLYKRNAQPDEHILQLLETQLRAHGYQVFIDRHLAIGVEWAKEIERQVRGADAVIPLLSAPSVQSEMLSYEVQIAHDAALECPGKPRLLPVRINFTEPLPQQLSVILDRLEYALWEGPQDDQRLVADLLTALRAPQVSRRIDLGMVGGAVPLDSPFYVVRPVDGDFSQALARRDTLVLVKGARQMGKTSLLARGLKQAREAGARVVLTDFQTLNANQLQTADTLFRTLAEWFIDELDLDVEVDEVWNPQRGANMNFQRFMRREVLQNIHEPLVWGMDEVDRLFACDFASEVFGLFRAWHNARSLDPSGPWSQLTMAIAYATEAHLFITDMNQSPFNVGTRLTLGDFSPAQVGDLNQRYESPLRSEADVQRFYQLVGGQPYLVRRGLHEMVQRGVTIEALEQTADRDEGPFGDHLRRFLVVLAKDPDLLETVRNVLCGGTCPTVDSFYRLRTAGLLAGEASREATFRCQLYASYLRRHLA